MIPGAEKIKKFWSDIWDCSLQHNVNVNWLRGMNKELDGLEKQEDIHIVLGKIKKQISRMLNWKSPDSDIVQGYWIKNLSSAHSRTGTQRN